jgi:hypothetical protein
MENQKIEKIHEQYWAAFGAEAHMAQGRCMPWAQGGRAHR